jgi:hypothetical protein
VEFGHDDDTLGCVGEFWERRTHYPPGTRPAPHRMGGRCR